MNESRLQRNPALSGLVAIYGVDAVIRGAMEVLGFPATLVGELDEATAISEFLEKEKQ